MLFIQPRIEILIAYHKAILRYSFLFYHRKWKLMEALGDII